LRHTLKNTKNKSSLFITTTIGYQIEKILPLHKSFYCYNNFTNTILPKKKKGSESNTERVIKKLANKNKERIFK
jgi:hypothetical protein